MTTLAIVQRELSTAPLWAVLPLLAVSAGDVRDTRATLVCTLLAVDSWGAL